MKKIFLLSILFVTVCNVNAQQNLTLYQMKGLPQTIGVNASTMPDSRLYVNLPFGMFSGSMVNSGFSFNDLFTKRSDDSLQFNADKVISGLSSLNIFSIDVNYDLLGVGMKFKGFYINFNSSIRFNTNVLYTKDMMQLALEGNGKNFIGKRASFDGFGVNMNAYAEYAFGVTKQLNDKLTVGGRFKLISGIANFRTKQMDLGLYTDPETYALTIDGEAEINSSNFAPFIDSNSNGVDFQTFSKDFARFANKGVGFDFAATYKINEKITTSASLVDLGTINWKNNTLTYKANVDYTFRGVDINSLFGQNADTLQDNAGTIIQDTLNEIFDYNSNTDGYSTSLNTKLYLSGSYLLTKQIQANVVIMNQFVKGKLVPALSLGSTVNLGKWLVCNVNYSIHSKTYKNLGLGFSLKGGPIQIYVLTDNVLAFIDPLSARSVNIAGGLSIFLKDKKDKKEKDSQKLK